MTHPRVWPNHHSQAILGTKFYRWVLWIDGDDSLRQTIRRVIYKLHPTFGRGVAISEDPSNHFRIDATGWGSFYARVLITYAGGATEEIPYFIDVTQFYRHDGPVYYKRCPKVNLTEEELLQFYSYGIRDFSGIEMQPSRGDAPLTQATLVAANFLNASLEGVKFLGANLAMTNFQGANLSNVDLSGANLTACRLTEATLSGAILYGVNRTDWIVDGARATHVFIDALARTRVPYGRDFAAHEFSQWLAELNDMKKIAAPGSPRAFISYARQDEKIVHAIDQWLRDHGIDVLLDKREFVAGQDLYKEIIDTMSRADKVIICYSANSKDRRYTMLEQRMAQELEHRNNETNADRAYMVYFCLDHEHAPLEYAHRISIRAKGAVFEDACQQLLNAIHDRGNETPPVDLSAWLGRPI